MLAAGSAIDPYWNIFKQHTNNPSIIRDILEPMKIGTISNYDSKKIYSTNLQDIAYFFAFHEDIIFFSK